MTDVSAAPAAAVDPGKGLGIAALVLAFFIQLVGLILGIVALSKSKKAGFKNAPAVWGIILSIDFGIGWVIFFGALIAGAVALGATCADLGPGVWETAEGVTITCG